MSEPIYKDVLGYPNYEVSLDGLIRRKNTPFRGAKIVRQCLNSVSILQRADWALSLDLI